MDARQTLFALTVIALLAAPAWVAAQPPTDSARELFDPYHKPISFDPAPRRRPSPRWRVEMNPGPLAARYLNAHDSAPTEPRDGPFGLRGELLNDGPNTTAFWRARRDLDLSTSYRLDDRREVMLGYSPAARGRFTPSDGTRPALLFLQFSRKW